MDNKLRDYYLEFQIKNATPAQLLIMLYDGLIQNAESADLELSATQEVENRLQASHYITKSINILTELNTCLRHNVDPVRCSTFEAIARTIGVLEGEDAERRMLAFFRYVLERRVGNGLVATAPAF